MGYDVGILMRRGFRPVTHLFLLRFLRFPLEGFRLERFFFGFNVLTATMIPAMLAMNPTHFIISSTCSPPFYTLIILLSEQKYKCFRKINQNILFLFFASPFYLIWICGKLLIRSEGLYAWSLMGVLMYILLRCNRSFLTFPRACEVIGRRA